MWSFFGEAAYQFAVDRSSDGLKSRVMSVYASHLGCLPLYGPTKHRNLRPAAAVRHGAR
jgi:hypothetical protein